jgi:hypothetical protein
MALHVYAPSCEHDDAHIVGTRADLMKLRDAIDGALDARARHRSSDSVQSFFDSAGEGYDVYIKVVPESVENNLSLPYAESIGRSLGRNEWTPDIVPTE